MTFRFFDRLISTSSLIVILTEEGGVCYLRAMGRVTRVADITVPHPDHSDVEWYIPYDTEPDPDKVLRLRFPQYAAAVIAAVARSKDVGTIYLYGSMKHVRGVLEHLPPQIRTQCILMEDELPEASRAPISERMYKSMMRHRVRNVPSPFSSSFAEHSDLRTQKYDTYDVVRACVNKLWIHS